MGTCVESAAAKKRTVNQYLGVCPTTTLWRNTVSNIVLRLPEWNERGISTRWRPRAALCIDASHGHPLGGALVVRGYWKMLDAINRARRILRPPNATANRLSAGLTVI
jgi:hypothetical protein